MNLGHVSMLLLLLQAQILQKCLPEANPFNTSEHYKSWDCIVNLFQLVLLVTPTKKNA